jgi:hypothetical protein
MSSASFMEWRGCFDLLIFMAQAKLVVVDMDLQENGGA